MNNDDGTHAPAGFNGRRSSTYHKNLALLLMGGIVLYSLTALAGAKGVWKGIQIYVREAGSCLFIALATFLFERLRRIVVSENSPVARCVSSVTGRADGNGRSGLILIVLWRSLMGLSIALAAAAILMLWMDLGRWSDVTYAFAADCGLFAVLVGYFHRIERLLQGEHIHADGEDSPVSPCP